MNLCEVLSKKINEKKRGFRKTLHFFQLKLTILDVWDKSDFD